MGERRTLYVCDGRCGLLNCKILARRATQILGLGFGATTPDGRIRLSTLRCQEQADAPLPIMIDEDPYLIRHPAELRTLLVDLLPL
jgi:NADH:ubiquinone oxidoreductase subunit E